MRRAILLLIETTALTGRPSTDWDMQAECAAEMSLDVPCGLDAEPVPVVAMPASRGGRRTREPALRHATPRGARCARSVGVRILAKALCYEAPTRFGAEAFEYDECLPNELRHISVMIDQTI